MSRIFSICTQRLLFVRSQPLRPDDVYRIVVYPAKAPYLATVRVTGTERIKVAGQEYPAIKLELELQRVTKNLQLEAHKKFKQATAWISDDRDRLLLKIKSEVFVGSVWAELESVKFRDPAPGATTSAVNKRRRSADDDAAVDARAVRLDRGRRLAPGPVAGRGAAADC